MGRSIGEYAVEFLTTGSDAEGVYFTLGGLHG